MAAGYRRVKGSCGDACQDRASCRAADAAAIDEGLTRVGDEIAAGNLVEDAALEDIHMHVEHRLGELIGPAAGRLHTARSRNDQVATDFKLFVRDCIDQSIAGIDALEDALLTRADEHAATVMPGFTHLQSGQPVTLGHHLMAYVAMLGRDRSRFADARARMNESPLGSAALAGTGFDLDRDDTAAALGFDRPTANSLDAVSDRDFAVDYLHAAALCSVHLSRLAEEIIIWASQPYGFVKLPDAWSTGSSIMPNKRNPDAAELVRGHSARIVGDLVAMLVLLKGLPLAYAKDLQDDKPPLFDAHDLLALSLAAMAGMIADLEFVPDQTARRRCGRPCHRDRPCRLAGQRGRRPVPRGAPHCGPRSRRCRSGGQSARRTDHRRAHGDRSPDRRNASLAKLSVESSVASRTLGWRDGAFAGSRSDQGRARGPGEEMMMRRFAILALPLALPLALAACGDTAPFVRRQDRRCRSSRRWRRRPRRSTTC